MARSASANLSASPATTIASLPVPQCARANSVTCCGVTAARRVDRLRDLGNRHTVGLERRERRREVLGRFEPAAHRADDRELARLELVRRRGRLGHAAYLVQHDRTSSGADSFLVCAPMCHTPAGLRASRLLNDPVAQAALDADFLIEPRRVTAAQQRVGDHPREIIRCADARSSAPPWRHPPARNPPIAMTIGAACAGARVVRQRGRQRRRRALPSSERRLRERARILGVDVACEDQRRVVRTIETRVLRDDVGAAQRAIDAGVPCAG